MRACVQVSNDKHLKNDEYMIRDHSENAFPIIM